MLRNLERDGGNSPETILIHHLLMKIMRKTYIPPHPVSNYIHIIEFCNSIYLSIYLIYLSIYLSI